MSHLSEEFINQYEISAPAWKNNPLGELVCRRTYCRVKDNGEYESWRDIISRVVNGCYDLQKHHVEKNGLGWNDEKGCISAQEMFDKMYNMKFSPPGRGLWTMGTDITKKKGIYAALNNCGFTSTADIKQKGSEPFRFLMDMCMLGVGVGFDVRGGVSEDSADKEQNGTHLQNLRAVQLNPREDEKQLTPQQEIKHATKEAYVKIYKGYLASQIKKTEDALSAAEARGDAHFASECKKSVNNYSGELEFVEGLESRQIKLYKIEDTREGWVNSTGALIDSYMLPKLRNRNVVFYYGDIRPAGQILKTFGGVSSGPEPLLDLHIMTRKLLQRQAESPHPYVTETLIVDLMNLIGRCVVAGNVRRSSEISLGDPSSQEFINLKNYQINPEREAWGWCSNNSIFATVGMDYSSVAGLIAGNGEPGLLWMDNVRKYSRMDGAPDNKDFRAAGTNPCITADTIISTSEGFLPVSELVGRDFTAIVNGIGYPSVTLFNGDKGFWNNGRKPVYRLTLANGMTLKATADHEIYKIIHSQALNSVYMVKNSVKQLGNEDYVAIDPLYCNKYVNSAWNDQSAYMMDAHDFIASRVVSVEYCGEEDVYDCTIDKIHRFSANGMIISNCSEQTLEDKELCCLVEVFIANHESVEEFLRTLKFAYLYAKTVTLGDSHWVATNRVMMRNRRIGCSLTGLVQFLAKWNIETLREWLDRGYEEIQKWDRIYSDWFAIPRSIKTTSIKPSGCLTGDTFVRVVANASQEQGTIKVSLYEIFSAYTNKMHPMSGDFIIPSQDLFIMNKDNKREKVTKLFYNGPAKVMLVPLEGGTVRCTPDHKFLLTNGEWKAAKDLRRGDDIQSYD